MPRGFLLIKTNVYKQKLQRKNKKYSDEICREKGKFGELYKLKGVGRHKNTGAY